MSVGELVPTAAEEVIALYEAPVWLVFCVDEVVLGTLDDELAAHIQIITTTITTMITVQIFAVFDIYVISYKP